MTDHNEALDRLRATNPVPTTEVIDPDELSTVAALCEERRLSPGHDPIHEPLLAPPRTNLVRPVLAFAAAFVTVIAAVGLFALLGRDGSPVVDEPSPMTTTVPVVTTSVPTEAVETVILETYTKPPEANDVAIGPDGSIWVATSWAGVARWYPGIDEPVFSRIDEGLPSDETEEVVIAPDGTVWVSGRGWVARSDNGDIWTPLSVPDPSDAMAIGPDGVIWIAHEPNLLSRFAGNDRETITIPEFARTTHPWATSMAVAPNGTVWAAMLGGDQRGILSYDGTAFTHHGPENGLPEVDFYDVAVAPDGTVWAGSENVPDGEPGIGVASFDGTAWTVHTTDDGLMTNSAAVVVGREGTVWAIHPAHRGTPGVSRFDGDGWTSFHGIEGSGWRASVDADGTLWMPTTDRNGVVGFDGVSTTVLELPFFEDVIRAPVPPIGSWDPILTETRSNTPPAAASCPPGTDPNAPGPVGQDRPWPDEYSDQPADFDRVWGRILLVDAHRDTWTFDVCTNTWHEMNTQGTALPEGGSLVYDVDSDHTVLFGEGWVWIYDRDSNAWEARPAGASGSFGWGGLAAFYDPQSGLIISVKDLEGEYGDGWTLSAYDVDTDEWTTLGVTDKTKGQIVGYAHTADRLVTLDALSEHGMALIDPRTGLVETVEQGHPEIVGGFGSVDLVNGADTVYGWSWGEGLCKLRPQQLGWECLPWLPHQSDLGHHGYSPSNAGVYDWLNERLVMTGGGYGGWNDEPMTYFDDVWSLDPEAGVWRQLVAPSS